MAPPPTLTLAIETSNPTAGGAGVAIGLERAGVAQVLGVEPVHPGGRHDDDLMPAIDRLARRLSLAPRDLARVAVSVGPGGYTGLRIAVATGKMIAEAAGARCVAVESALVVARRADAAGRRFAVALASKGETTFATVFDIHGSAESPGRLIGADDLAGLGVTLLLADPFVPEPVRARAGALGIDLRSPAFDPGACLEASLHLPEIDPAALVPHYPREPEAVTVWRVRGGEKGHKGPKGQRDRGTKGQRN